MVGDRMTESLGHSPLNSIPSYREGGGINFWNDILKKKITFFSFDFFVILDVSERWNGGWWKILYRYGNDGNVLLHFNFNSNSSYLRTKNISYEIFFSPSWYLFISSIDEISIPSSYLLQYFLFEKKSSGIFFSLLIFVYFFVK